MNEGETNPNQGALLQLARSLGQSRGGQCFVAVAVAVFAMRGRVSVPEPLEVGLLLTLMPLISPQGWDYVFLLSTLAVMSLVNYSDQLPRYIRAPVIAAVLIVAFSIFDLIGRPAYQLFMRLSMITICYLVIIAGLVALRARRVA